MNERMREESFDVMKLWHECAVPHSKYEHVMAFHKAATAAAQAELKVTDELLADRQRVLDAIPECPDHGACVPHALEWVETAKGFERDIVAAQSKIDEQAQVILAQQARIKELHDTAKFWYVSRHNSERCEHTARVLERKDAIYTLEAHDREVEARVLEEAIGLCREITANTHERWPDEYAQGYAQGIGAVTNQVILMASERRAKQEEV